MNNVNNFYLYEFKNNNNFSFVDFESIAIYEIKSINEENGSVIVSSSRRVQENCKSESNTMLIVKSYFKPVKAVLSALQSFDVTNVPFGNFLVCGSTESTLPEYLQNHKIISDNG